MKKRLMLLTALVLCLYVLLLSGRALADWYSVSVEDFADVLPYCEQFVLSDGFNSEYNSGGFGIDVDHNPSANIELRILPNPGCGVDAIVYSYTEYGMSQTTRCTLRTSASGEVTTSFPMPLADVTVRVTMTRDGAVISKAEASFLHCSGTLSDGTQTGSGSIHAESGSNVTVTAFPVSGYTVNSMSYTTRSDPVSRTIPFTTGADGTATGSFVMPSEPVYVSVTASQPAMSYISHDANGVCLGSQDCTAYTILTDGNSDYYDLYGTYGGWYIVRGTVNMGSDTTIRVNGDVHLILCDGATLNANDGVYIRKGSSLSVYGQSAGTGKLVARPDGGPGIGGMADTVAGSLYIHGGMIDAKGGTNAAGIGGGNHESGYEAIVIYGGSVKAEGGSSGAGIGKGQQNSPGDCGLIAIYGGEVTAFGGSYGAGIGGGEDRDGGTIRIHGGTVTATGGHDGAGIGGGEGGSGGDIRIYSGTVIAHGGNMGAGVGGGEHGNSGTVQIHGGSVEAYGAYESKEKWNYGAGIGGGKAGQINPQVLITGGTVHAEGGAGRGAGIGSCESGGDGAKQGGDVIITGGSVTAIGGYGSAGIGGSGDYGDGGKVTIEGGQVEAHGGENAAGIGGGMGKDWGGKGGSVTIIDGRVTAIGGERGGAGVGGSRSGGGGVFVIRGGRLTAIGGEGGGAGVGGGLSGGEGEIRIEGGTVIATPDAPENTGTYAYPPEALGNGKRNNYRAHDGILTLYVGAMVAADITPERLFGISLAGDRIDTCRLDHTVTISPCDHSYRFYTVTETAHTLTCPHCAAAFQPAEHTFENGACTVCGYAGASVTVTYLPGHEHAGGTMSQEGYAPGRDYVIAECRYEVSGYTFSGWLVEETGTILRPGERCTLSTSLTLTATWRKKAPDPSSAGFILSEDITTIEAGAFEGAAMTAVFVPDGCTSIGDHAFRNCQSLADIRIPADCALGEEVFSGCGTVYVFSAAGSLAEAYCQHHDNCVFVAE